MVTLTEIQAQGALLTETIDIFKSVRPKLEKITARPEFLKKFDDVVAKNKALATLQQIALVLNGEKLNQPDNYIDSLCPTELEAFKYAPVVSCDVERSFSQYKQILQDCRRSFVFENLRKHLIIYCNKFN